MSTRGWENATMADVATRTMPQKRTTLPQVQRSKYRAVRCEVDGFTFASKAEAARYTTLMMLGGLGLVRNLELQPRFPILLNGILIATYVADFRYEEQNDFTDRWEDVIEDVKGFKTPVYRLKKKIIEALYRIQIREIR